MDRTNLKIRIFLLLIVSVFLISACQSLPLRSPEEVLEKRVSEMMDARVNNNWSRVYQYLDPDFKKNVTKNEFAATDRNIFYSNYAIEDIKLVSENQAAVSVKYDMRVMSFDVSGHRETQNWVKQRGKWYFKMDKGTGMDLKN
jgi:uncharacterized protein YchJ